MKVSFQSGSGIAGIVRYANNDFVSGNHFGVCINNAAQNPPQLFRVDFNHLLESFKFGWGWMHEPATVTVYGEDGSVISVLDYPQGLAGGFWVDYQAASGPVIAWITILTQDYSFIDNFKICHRD